MTLSPRPTLTVAEVSAVAASVPDIEGAVAALPPEFLFVYLKRLEQVTELAGKWKKAIEGRMFADGMVGAHWTDTDDKEYAFLRSSRGDFADPRALFADLIALGMSPLSIAEAVSKLRVTDLRKMAEGITDDEKRETVLGVVEDHRTKIEGAPRLVDLDAARKYGGTAKKKGA